MFLLIIIIFNFVTVLFSFDVLNKTKKLLFIFLFDVLQINKLFFVYLNFSSFIGYKNGHNTNGY